MPPANVERRALLTTQPNPDCRRDYVVTMDATLECNIAAAPVSIVVRYIPDRFIISSDAFAGYLSSLELDEWSSLEHLAATVLDDLTNEVVARWTQLSMAQGAGDGGGVSSHEILLEDRQPHWDNPALLERLKRV